MIAVSWLSTDGGRLNGATFPQDISLGYSLSGLAAVADQFVFASIFGALSSADLASSSSVETNGQRSAR